MKAIIRLNLIDGDTVFLNLANKHVWVGEGWIALGDDYEDSQTFLVTLTNGSTDKDLLAEAVSEAYIGQKIVLNQREVLEEDESEEDESEEDESEEDESEEDEANEAGGC